MAAYCCYDNTVANHLIFSKTSEVVSIISGTGAAIGTAIVVARYNGR
jgi:hypothetical protein